MLIESHLDSYLKRCLASWSATTPSPVDISGNFTSRKFIVALQHSKPGKAPGPDSIFPEDTLHAGTALKFLLRGFLPACLR